MKTALVICGTRPEGIKLAPVIKALRDAREHFDTRLCVTGQHRQMLDPVLAFFGLKADVDLDLMRPGQTLFDVTANALLELRKVLEANRPDVVLVQGDTTTAFAGALAAYYLKVKVAHVEAGLRTGQKYAPFPEELNRSLIGRLADFHFAPTEGARRALEAEGLREHVYVTGNTVTDALLDAQALLATRRAELDAEFAYLVRERTLVLVTGHRRESFGAPFEAICRALKAISEQHPNVELVYPVHLNPNVREPVGRILAGAQRIHLIEPVDYPRLVYLLSRCHFVLTDSGGIQEEAPSLGKPVLVMREVTERPEGIEAGCAALVGTDERRIVESANRLLLDAAAYRAMAQVKNPYGDGQAAKRIVELLRTALA